MPEPEAVLVLDFGSQYSHLIARRIRELKVRSDLVPFDIPPAEIARRAPKGIVLSGGPASVYADGAPRVDPAIFSLPFPILGICYGMQLLADALGGTVARASAREFGPAALRVAEGGGLLEGLPPETPVWMSHGDQVVALPPGFRPIADTATCPLAAARHGERPIFGVQFHPEVTHTPKGKEILRNFLYRVCGCAGRWRMSSFVRDAVRSIRARAPAGNVILGLSGGVDSSVTAALLQRAVGERLRCIFVDNGLVRRGEPLKVRETFEGHFRMNLAIVDARERFYAALKGIEDPEAKRKAIGRAFIEAFREAAARIPDARYLAQGTLYPDVIESVSFRGPSATIKSHHNVGGLPAELGFTLIEPLRELFKDEVRRIGKVLKVPDEILRRQPFPGPGLAVRILGEVTPERVILLQAADAIVLEEMKRAGWYRRVWQSFAVLLPVRTVGVMGDERTYENVCALRVVTSDDGMTADWVDLPKPLLSRLASRIVNEVRGINRVVYDITSKPPGTIEWE